MMFLPPLLALVVQLIAEKLGIIFFKFLKHATYVKKDKLPLNRYYAEWVNESVDILDA